MARDRALVGVQALLGGAFAVAWLRSLAAVGLVPHLVSVGLLAIGLGVGVAALWDLRRAFRIAPTPRDDASLVTRGVYRHLRHPMYNAVLLIVAGLAVVRPDALVVALAVANAVFYPAKARYEEGLLRDRYPGYEAYRRRTVGVLPGL